MTIPEFVKKHNITSKPVFVGKREDKKKGHSSWKHFLWIATLERGAAKMDTEYRMGVGHITLTRPLNGIRPGTIAHEEHLARWSKPTPPDAETVLNSLISDADALDRSFEDWASELGYDEDSREAERIYFACKDGGRKLLAFLGRDLFNELNQCERL